MEECLTKIGFGDVSKLMVCGFSDARILTIVNMKHYGDESTQFDVN
jgi:hypothetical protein